ncbi:Rcs stress response system protein RcsF [Xenorhabdus kozodoii]|uniref:Outer membrane lipoprotein RcsF n=1 Tax=Xenorhabdus kozodoii TaxID=351676 RepID=A0A2D0LC18_9GAMM|nr:Rcs stress response system protein RcsF [Xenorhabdus kozodoii]PHM73183.1 membrane protein [Xenorhabdus kozodoii]
MRVLPICFMALFIAGCTSLPTQPNESKMPDPALKHQSVKKDNMPSYVRLYTKPDELLGLPFKELGTVAGESCRNTLQDSPASIATARQNMLTKASRLNANAVLLHQCAILSGYGCYQIAICEGSALLTTPK